MPKTKDGDAVGVTEHDSNYLGTNPEYENSAYIGNAPVVEGEEDEVTARVREHVDAMAQPQSEVKSFADWTAARGAARSGEVVTDDDDDDPTKTELMVEARELDIAGRSSMDKDELAAAVAEAKEAKAAAADTPS